MYEILCVQSKIREEKRGENIGLRCKGGEKRRKKKRKRRREEKKGKRKGEKG